MLDIREIPQNVTVPETITLSGEQAYRIAALLLGVDEFFSSVTRLSPPAVGEEFMTTATELWRLLFPEDLEHLPDREYETHPVIVDQYATGYERAAKMLRGALKAAEDGWHDSVYGQSRREAWELAGRLEAEAAAFRLAGDIDPIGGGRDA